MPEDYDHAKAEAAHLIYESDVDSVSGRGVVCGYSELWKLWLQDQRLSKEEILQHQDVFVGSQATDFGDYLVRHDEF